MPRVRKPNVAGRYMVCTWDVTKLLQSITKYTVYSLVLYCRRVQPAPRDMKFGGYEWQTYHLLLGKTDSHNKIDLHSQILHKYCFESINLQKKLNTQNLETNLNRQTARKLKI